MLHEQPSCHVCGAAWLCKPVRSRNHVGKARKGVGVSLAAGVSLLASPRRLVVRTPFLTAPPNALPNKCKQNTSRQRCLLRYVRHSEPTQTAIIRRVLANTHPETRRLLVNRPVDNLKSRKHIHYRLATIEYRKHANVWCVWVQCEVMIPAAGQIDPTLPINT